MINLAEFGVGASKQFQAEFRPVAKYLPAMDCLIYLREDVSYRAIRLDQHRTVLLHPTEDRAVGVKLKGMRFIMEKARAVLTTVGADTSHFLLITLWELTMMEVGEEEIAEADFDRRRQYAERAKELVQKEHVPLSPAELPLAA